MGKMNIDGCACMDFTVETRLAMQEDDMGPAREYFSGIRKDYGHLFRRMWKDLIRPGADLSYKGRKEYVKAFMAEHGILKRTANSLWNDVAGRMASYTELKKTELGELGDKIESLEETISTLEERRDALKPAAVLRQASDSQLSTYRRTKKDLYHKKNKLNRLRQKYAKLEGEIDHGEFHICFGTKKLFGAQYRLEENGFASHAEWRRAFRQKRDANVFFLGSSDEKYGNQLFRVQPCGDVFLAFVRKEYKYCRSNRNADKYLCIGAFDIKHLKKELMDAVRANAKTSLKGDRSKCLPLSYRIHFEGTKCYLQVIFSIGYKKEEYITRADNGVFGMDFNDGFIEVAETDRNGNLAGLERYVLKYHGQGEKGKHEICEATKKIMEKAAKKGKDTFSEDLDFIKTKAKMLPASSKSGKQYNRMLSTLDHRRYNDALDAAAHKQHVYHGTVWPSYTSKIGEQKYAGRMKLTTHQSAAYVIARRGQGFKDRYIPPETKGPEPQENRPAGNNKATSTTVSAA